MKSWYLLALPFFLLLPACVGQKEDPDELPQPDDGSGDVRVSADEGTRPFHRVLALEFTASWCTYCPNMAAALAEAQRARPGRIMDIAVHWDDEVSSAEADTLVDRFKASGLPQLVFDWDGGTMFNEQSVKRFTDYVDATVGNPTCNMALECRYSGGSLEADLSVKADVAAAYSVAAALVQDRMVVVNQAGYGPGYSCMSVLRRFLGAGMDGESLGKLEKDQEGSASFTAQIDLGDAPEADFRVVAFVRKNGGRVVNAITVPLNGKLNYQYEKEEDS